MIAHKTHVWTEGPVAMEYNVISVTALTRVMKEGNVKMVSVFCVKWYHLFLVYVSWHSFYNSGFCLFKPSRMNIATVGLSICTQE